MNNNTQTPDAESVLKRELQLVSFDHAEIFKQNSPLTYHAVLKAMQAYKSANEPKEVKSAEATAIAERLEYLIPLHINPYNLGDMGEVAMLLNKAIKILKRLTHFKTPPPASTDLNIITQTWNAAITEAANECAVISNDYNANDETERADAAIRCAKSIREFLNDVHPDVLQQLQLPAPVKDSSILGHFNYDREKQTADYVPVKDVSGEGMTKETNE